jgi:hypothetical protein
MPCDSEANPNHCVDTGFGNKYSKRPAIGDANVRLSS